MPNGSADRMPLERSRPLENTRLPCPSWCGDTPGHPFDSVNIDHGTVARLHTLTIGSDVDITADETAITAEGPVWESSAPGLSVYVEPGDRLDGPTARRIAGQLLKGASILERLS